MIVRINDQRMSEENERCARDLLHNANTCDYTNVKGFKQKLIDLLYKLDYYKYNESIFPD